MEKLLEKIRANPDMEVVAPMVAEYVQQAYNLGVIEATKETVKAVWISRLRELLRVGAVKNRGAGDWNERNL